MRTREATSDDFDELWEIDQRCFQAGIAYSRRELTWYMKLRGAFTVVGESQAAPRARWNKVAFVVGQQVRRDFGHIITIDVLPEARRTGLGTRLMAEAETRLQQQGCDTIFLETAVDNVAAIRFYKKLGYYVVKTLPRYYLDKIDALMMAKLLKKA